MRPQGLELWRRAETGNEIPANSEGSLYFIVVNFLTSFFFFFFLKLKNTVVLNVWNIFVLTSL